MRNKLFAIFGILFFVGCGEEEPQPGGLEKDKGDTCKPACAYKCPGASDGCGGTCQVNDCKNGCCLNGQCFAGESDHSCGSDGVKCVDCTEKDSVCSGGTCGYCTPNCTGKCAGEADGCGSKCLINTCSGCCTDEANPTCLAGTTQSACGADGVNCSVCSSDYQGYSWICDSGSKTCVRDTPTM